MPEQKLKPLGNVYSSGSFATQFKTPCYSNFLKADFCVYTLVKFNLLRGTVVQG